MHDATLLQKRNCTRSGRGARTLRRLCVKSLANQDAFRSGICVGGYLHSMRSVSEMAWCELVGMGKRSGVVGKLSPAESSVARAALIGPM